MSESVDDFVAAFEKAATVARAFGDSIGALQPLEGERLLPYRQRLARKYQAQSTQFKDVDLSKVGCEVTLAAIEDSIFQDALHPTSFKPGVLRRVGTRDAAGREITRYYGDPNACWDQFNPPIRHILKFNTPGRAA